MPGFSRPSRILKRDFRRAADSESIRRGGHFIFQTASCPLGIPPLWHCLFSGFRENAATCTQGTSEEGSTTHRNPHTNARARTTIDRKKERVETWTWTSTRRTTRQARATMPNRSPTQPRQAPAWETGPSAHGVRGGDQGGNEMI